MGLEPRVLRTIGAVNGLPGRSDEPGGEEPRSETSAGGRWWAAARRLLFNAFPFVVVALFFWLQTVIMRQTHGAAMQAELGAAVLVEIGLVFVWSLLLD